MNQNETLVNDHLVDSLHTEIQAPAGLSFVEKHMLAYLHQKSNEARDALDAYRQQIDNTPREDWPDRGVSLTSDVMVAVSHMPKPVFPKHVMQLLYDDYPSQDVSIEIFSLISRDILRLSDRSGLELT